MMTITNRKATDAYLHALNDMTNTKPGYLARLADRMAGEAFDEKMPAHTKPIACDRMVDIETAIFVGLCEANEVNWRLLQSEYA